MRNLIAGFAAGLITLWWSTAMAATFTNLSSDDQQVAAAANTAYAITMSGDATPGFTVSGSKVTIKAAGDYFVIAAAQVGGSATGNVYLWTRLNGKDVPRLQFDPVYIVPTIYVGTGFARRNDVQGG